jgi:hypothetical protein
VRSNLGRRSDSPIGKYAATHITWLAESRQGVEEIDNRAGWKLERNTGHTEVSVWDRRLTMKSSTQARKISVSTM